VSWTKWEAKLRGEKVIDFTQPGEDDEGYYRKPIREKSLNAQGKTNGQSKIIGWEPVAYWLDGGLLCGVIGDRDMTGNEVIDNWTWVCRYAITEAQYRAVAERGEAWPDLPIKSNYEPATLTEAQINTNFIAALQADIPAANRDVARSDNAPPEVSPDVEHATAIDNAIGAGKDLPVTTVAEAEIASGAANIIRERRLAAEKAAKRVVDPLKTAYEDERAKWLPPVQRAKATEDAIRLRVSNFEIAERKRVAAEQLAALEKQREIDEANARAADRAIASGEPEQAPVVEEIAIPLAPAKTKPTYGSYTPRAKPILKFAVIQDEAMVLNHFKFNVEIVMLVQKLATNDIRAGLEVPGATFREGIQ
jgi:hypothetical protein